MPPRPLANFVILRLSRIMEREIFCDDGVVTSLDECDQAGVQRRGLSVMLIRTRSAWSASVRLSAIFCSFQIAIPDSACDWLAERRIKRGRRMSCVRIAGSDRSKNCAESAATT